MRLTKDVDVPINPLPKEKIVADGSMENIYVTIPINIFVNSHVVENMHIGANYSPKEISIYIALFKELHDMFSYSYEEILGIDPLIVEHEIRTYPDAKPV